MVRIIADTTSSIPVEEARRLGIYYIPQIIIFGDETYRDDTEIDNKTFLKKLRESPVLPKTAAPPPELYKPMFEEITANHDSCVIICPSVHVSGTVRSANVAAMDFPDTDIRIIDSKTIGSGLASIVLQANEWARQGLDTDTVVQKVEDMCSRLRVYFLVDTLEYLHKGGRIGGAQALLGNLLQVKPILTLKDGEVQPAESQRTRQRALAKLIELVTSFYPKDANGYLTIMHGDSFEEARKLAQTLGAALNLDPETITIYDLPPAILTHVGPGVLAAGYVVV